MALETSFHHLTAQVSSVLALNSPAIFPYGSPGVLSHGLKLLVLTLPGRAQVWSAHKLSTWGGQEGDPGPHSSTGTHRAGTCETQARVGRENPLPWLCTFSDWPGEG